MGGDLSPERLVLAYRMGIFPWFERTQPILWWSPNPRCILKPHQLKISRSLKKSFRNKGYTCTCNQSFEKVISACSDSRIKSSGTWITEEMKRAYLTLHQLGIAHSVEVWANNDLVGGLYGICLGPFFFGESMFSRQSDASKVALIYLMNNLVPRGLVCVDCQVENPHLLSLGAGMVARDDFCNLLERHLGTTLNIDELSLITSPATLRTIIKQQAELSIWPYHWNTDFEL